MLTNKIRIQSGGDQYFDIRVAKNQKVVQIIKKNEKGYILDLEANKQAMGALTPGAYMLYMHFVLNVPNYIEALSLKNITSNTALSERTYYSAVKELIDKRYLVKKQSLQYENFYLFYEEPIPI